MGLVSEIGTAFGFSNNKVWKLTSNDGTGNQFIGQFIAENLTENVGARIGEAISVGNQNPALHWISGDVETITFNARIFRTSPVKGAVFDALSNPVGTGFNVLGGSGGPAIANASVRDEIEKLKKFTRPNEEFGRLERFVFTYGTEMEFLVFVQSVGGIVYDEIRSDGTIRGCTFQMQLKKIDPANLATKQGDPGVSLAAGLKTAFGIITTVAGGVAAVNKLNRGKLINIPGGSLHTVTKTVKIKQGMTFESIARKEYGNPLLGDVLRRAQPDKADLKPGDTILLVKKEEIVQIPVTPQSVALRDTAENKLLLQGYLNLRGKKAALIV